MYRDLKSFQNTGHGHQLNKFLINENKLKYLENPENKFQNFYLSTKIAFESCLQFFL